MRITENVVVELDAAQEWEWPVLDAKPFSYDGVTVEIGRKADQDWYRIVVRGWEHCETRHGRIRRGDRLEMSASLDAPGLAERIRGGIAWVLPAAAEHWPGLPQ